MERIIPISDLQTKAKRFVEQVRKTDEPVVITQRGRPAAVLVNYETYEGHLATSDEMRYPDWKSRLARAERENRANKGIEIEKYLKARSGLRSGKKAA